jgi:hypothetical protein
MWIVGFVALIGNVVVYVLQLTDKYTKSLHGHTRLMLNLCISNCVMTFYTFSTSTADALYRGVYLDNERIWESSVMCKITGIMFVVSYEVSVFILSLLAIERLLILKFPMSTVHWSRRSLVLSAVFAWLLGCLLALVPLLPALTHGNFYGHSGVCIPVLGSGQGDQGSYLFATMTTGSAVILFITVVCMVIVDRNPAGSLVDETSGHNVNVRVMFMATGNLLCKMPVCVLGLAAVSGMDVPEDVGVAVTVYLMPLSAALCPVLYAYRLLAERRQRQHRKRIKMLLDKQSTLKSTHRV